MINRSQYAEERREQITFLNSILGGFAFTISLSCLQMSNPNVAIYVCAPFIISLAIAGYQKFPRSIKGLREQAKSDSKAKELNDYIHSTDYGVISLVKHFLPFIIGYGFFLFVLAFPAEMKNILNG